MSTPLQIVSIKDDTGFSGYLKSSSSPDGFCATIGAIMRHSPGPANVQAPSPFPWRIARCSGHMRVFSAPALLRIRNPASAISPKISVPLSTRRIMITLRNSSPQMVFTCPRVANPYKAPKPSNESCANSERPDTRTCAWKLRGSIRQATWRWKLGAIPWSSGVPMAPSPVIVASI